MARFFLWGASGYLIGSLSVGFALTQILSFGCLFLAGAIIYSVSVSWRKGIGVVFFAIFFVGGWWQAMETAMEWRSLPESIAFQGDVVVVKQGIARSFYQPITLRSISTEKIAADILWRAPKTVSVPSGHILNFDCLLKRPENFDPHFDYRAYLATQDIGYICDVAQEAKVSGASIGWRVHLFSTQEKLRDHIHQFLPDPAASLLQGLFLGGDDGLPKSLRDHFRRAGLSHIVAVSGYNMTLVAFTVLFLALSFGLWRKTATLLAAIGILIFLLLIDTGAASLRAALMAWMVFLAFFLGRPASAPNALLLAGCLLAWFNPLIVRYDVGFQLSLLATLALITVGPWLTFLFESDGWFRKIHQTFVMVFGLSVAVSIFITPILLFHFGTVSLLSPVANIVTLFIPLIMGLGFLMLLLGALIPLLGTILAFPTWGLLTLLIGVGEQFGSVSWGILEGIKPSISFIVGWYIVLAFAVWYSRASLKRYALRMDH